MLREFSKIRYVPPGASSDQFWILDLKASGSLYKTILNNWLNSIGYQLENFNAVSQAQEKQMIQEAQELQNSEALKNLREAGKRDNSKPQSLIRRFILEMYKIIADRDVPYSVSKISK